MESEQEAEERSDPVELVPAVKESEAKLEEKKSTPHISSHPAEGVVKLNEESQEKTMEENKNTPQSSSHDHEVMAGNLKNDPKLDKEPTEDTTREEDKNTPQLPLEKIGSQPEEGNDEQEMLKQGQEHEYEFPDSCPPSGLKDQTDSKCHTSPSKELTNHPCEQLNEKFDKQQINGTSSSGFHPTDLYEGCIQEQPTKKNSTLGM